MNRVFIHTLLAILITFGLAVGASNVYAQHDATPGSGPSPEDSANPAEQVFKNIQVFKGTPANQVIPAMQFISNSLGVECDFCHVRGAFEKDDKEAKKTARKMITMQTAINRENFEGETHVTCNTCHNGSAAHPSGAPLISNEPPKPAETPKAETAAALPTADQLIDKYVQAVGGADALKKIASRVHKGTITIGGRQLPVEVFSKAPNKRISLVHTPNGDNITAFDGRAGWIGNPGPRPPRDMTAQEIEAASFDATFYLPLELKSIFDRFQVRSVDKIGGHDAIQVVANKGESLPVRLFFDKESGLLVRTLRYADTPLGPNPTQVDYSDYRAQDGVKIPFQWTLARPLGRFTIQVTELQQNVPVDDSKFAKPSGAAPAEQKPPAK